jgi:epoxyqueuosine reductase QueG
VKKRQNFQIIKSFFNGELAKIGYDGIIGVTDFKRVYDNLMPIQRNKLQSICGDKFQTFMKNGSIICIGIAYPEHTIDCIDVRLSDGTVDKATWNIYAREYHKLNRVLNTISKNIAESFGGIPIPATLEGLISNVKNVEEYYGMTVSHRVIAENAGLGWRGKNELIVNEKLSCALRFASIITDLPLFHGEKVKASCGECEACLKACTFLKNKDKLKNYRESCRRYIIQLGLDADVCGKCIKACYQHSAFSNRFKLK